MTPEDIKVFLNSKSAPTMTAPKPTTADVTEAATSKVSKLTLAQVKKATAAKRKKATLAAKKKAAAAKKIDIAKKAITDRKLPGNIKFLYIPTKK